MNELIGKKVVGLSVRSDESLLAFATTNGVVAFEVEGDCCSQSWFADIVGVDALIGATVAAVEEVELPEWCNVDDGRSRQQEDSAYGYKIRTDKGYCDVVFRNSSNGYYGGWLRHYDGKTPGDMKPITADWSAS